MSEIAQQQASAAGSSSAPVKASTVGRLFLRHYFKSLQTQFDQLHDLYAEDAVLTHRTQLGEPEAEVQGPRGIQEFLEKKGWRNARWIVWDLVTCQHSTQGGVVLNIAGTLQLPAEDPRDAQPKCFTQTWILARISGSYLIRNDILTILPVQPDLSSPVVPTTSGQATAAVGQPADRETPKRPAAASKKSAPPAVQGKDAVAPVQQQGQPKRLPGKRGGKSRPQKPEASAAAAAADQKSAQQNAVEEEEAAPQQQVAWAARVGSKAAAASAAAVVVGSGKAGGKPQAQQQPKSQQQQPQKPQQQPQQQRQKDAPKKDAQQQQAGGKPAPLRKARLGGIPQNEGILEHSVHVGGLPPLAGEKMEDRIAELKQLFAQFGTVVNAFCPKPNFAFVEFSDVPTRQKAVNSAQKTPLQFQGNQLTVTDRQKPRSRFQGPPHRAAPNQHHPRGPRKPFPQNKKNQNRPQQQRQQQSAVAAK